MISTVVAQTASYEFSFATGKGYSCVYTDTTAYWEKVDTKEQINIFYDMKSTTGVCNNITYSDAWCCPQGYHCISGECILPETAYAATVCTSIADQNSCNYAAPSFAIEQVSNFGAEYSDVCTSGGIYEGFFDSSSDSVCANVTECGCSWSLASKSCVLNISLEKVCPTVDSAIGSCTWAENPNGLQDMCESDGKVIISYLATKTADYSRACVDQTVSYPCSVSVQLPFFDSFGFILSALLIVCVYCYIRKN